MISVLSLGDIGRCEIGIIFSRLIIGSGIDVRFSEIPAAISVLTEAVILFIDIES